MPAVPNVPKKGVSPVVRSPIRERGQAKRGGKREIDSCSPTPPACRAEILVRFRITPTTMSMADQSIFYYPVQNPSVSPAITVSITIGSNALNVAKLEQNKKVEFAIGALAQTIRNELYLRESTGKESGTKSNLIKINLPMHGKKNIEKV